VSLSPCSSPPSSVQEASRYSRLHHRGRPLFHTRGAPYAENHSGSWPITVAHRGGIIVARGGRRTSRPSQTFTWSWCRAAPSPAVAASVDRCLLADSSATAAADALAVQHCLAFLEAVRIRITEGYPCFPVPSPVCLID
jgi:hypothetical protein